MVRSAKKVSHRLERRSKMTGVGSWRTFAGGGRETAFEGRVYSINPRFEPPGRSGGWALRVSPGQRGLHEWIGKDGGPETAGSFPFTTPAHAARMAAAFAKRVGPEPHGIMAGWTKTEDKITATMREPDFWHRVEKLKDEAQAQGDADMARICRVAISERPVRPEGHDARECARALLHGQE